MVPSQFPPTVTARNIGLWPDELADLEAEVELAAPDYDGPGLDDATVPRPYALLGPGATGEGLGDLFRDALLVPAIDRLPADDPRRELPDNHDLGRALLDLATNRIDGAEHKVDQWRTGTLVPLPAIQLEGRWIVFYQDVLDQIPSPFPLFPTPVNVPATELYGPTAITPPDRLEDYAEHPPDSPYVLVENVTKLIHGATAAQLAAEAAPDLLANPYAECLTVVEMLLQLEAADATAGHALATALVSHFMLPQLDVLAWTTGGNAVLRRLWARLTPADTPYGTVARALGLEVRTPASGSQPAVYHPPQQRRPAVVPVEPPLTTDQRKVGGNAVGAMALGRRYVLGWAKFEGWQGPTTGGLLRAETFDAARGATVPYLSSLTEEQVLDRRHVVISVADAEGGIDAVRLADSALLSLGMQQWSVHVNTELSLLLAHLQRRAPDHYDVFFGLHNLALVLCDAAGKVDASLPLTVDPKLTTTADAVLAANPRAFTNGVANAPRDYYPTFVTLAQVQAGADPVVMPVPSTASTARFDFFGWTKPKKSPNTGTPAWGARGWAALQCSHHLQESELAVGVFRFTRISDECSVWDDDWTKGLTGAKVRTVDRSRHPVTPTGLRLGRLCPADHTLFELFGSEYAAGVILDGHINAPNAVKAAIMRSWQRTVDIFRTQARAEMESSGLTPSDDEVEVYAHAMVHSGGGEVLSELFLLRFIVSYTGLRGYTEGTTKESPRFLSVFGDRDRRVLMAHDNTLPSTLRGFAGWA